MSTPTPNQISQWQARWKAKPEWAEDVVDCLLQEPRSETVTRILKLPWYTEANGFHPVTFSPQSNVLILDLRGILLRNLDLQGIVLPMAHLEGANFTKSDLTNSNLSFSIAHQAIFHQTIFKSAILKSIQWRQVDLSMADLEGADLLWCDLTEADLGWASLKNAHFRQALLTGAVFEGAELSGTVFTDSNLESASFNIVKGIAPNLSSVNLQKAKFVAANLESANFYASNLIDCDLTLACLPNSLFENASLQRADFTQSHLDKADFTGADLALANCRNAHFEGGTLNGVILIEAQLHGANFKKAMIKNADLRSADLTEAELLDANLEGADLRGAKLDQCYIRSPLHSAVINEATKFGHSADIFSNEVMKDGTPQSYYTHYKIDAPRTPDASELESIIQMCGKLALLYQDNGLHFQAAAYSSEKRHWKTRLYQLRGHYWRYLGRRIFYESSCGYGEKPGRLLLLSLALVLIFALGYCLSGLSMNPDGRTIVTSIGQPLERGLQESLLFSVQSFTSLKITSLQPGGLLCRTLSFFESLTGLFMLVLIVILYVRKALRF
ncbi:MAG: pentapeptide repeat-containing protein [bacterium]|nr:pentapeptide repeat-containing protein [bacterium]